MLPLKDTIPNRNPSIATWLLIAANVLVFLFELSLPTPALEALFRIFGIVPARYTTVDMASGATYQYWPFLTSMFLHSGWWHLIGNMWALWIFGKSVEERLGSLRFVVFYLLSGIAASLTHMMLNPGSTLPSVGASGAISGVMGAYLMMFPTSRIIAVIPVFIFPFFFELPAVVFLGLWFLIQFFGAAASSVAPSQVGGVAFWAHVGGFVFGMLTYRFFQLNKPRRFERDELGAAGAWRRPRWQH
ncbi:MAG: rhomboid family intramembrane serine protease [Terriglobales bacterium]